MPRKPRQPRKDKRPGRKPKPKNEKAAYMKVADRRPKVHRLRIEGYTPEQISVKLGITLVIVNKDLRILHNKSQQRTNDREAGRDLQKAQLNMLWQALQEAIEAKDTKAIAVALKVLERGSKLMGLDAKTRIEIETKPADRDWDELLG